MKTFVVLVVLAAPVLLGAQSVPTFRSSVDLVTVGVSVRDHNAPVTGLKASDFSIKDNGVPQEIVDISYETVPVDVTVALDISQSVTGELLDRMRRGVGMLAADLLDADRLKLLTFNNRVRRLLDFDGNRAVAQSALTGTTAGGRTSLLDALAVALMAPIHQERRHLVIVFSDGIDTGSVTDRPTLLALARQAGTTVTFVLPAGGAMGPEAPLRKYYDQIASETGGLVVPMLRVDDLGPTFTRVFADFRSSYVLHFSPKGVNPAGDHTLEVQVPKRGGVEIRARRSYALR